jgi:hypothetical protein
MRMNLFDKFLLAVVLLLLLAMSLFIGIVAVGLIPLNSISTYFTSLSGELGLLQINALIFGAVALVLFVVVIRLLVANYSSSTNLSYTRLSVTETGEISISVPTIKQITAAFISGKPDVIASSSVILPTKEGLVVNLRICPKDGVILPDITVSVQKELKAHLETITGLEIKLITVMVDNNRSNYSGKVR